MVEVNVVKQKLQDYIVNQIDILGESNPAIKLVKPLAKRAIINNIDSFDKFINTIAKDGKIDIEGIVDEEIEIIKSIPNFDFNIPVLSNIIMREVPYETGQDVRARSRRDEMYERINDFLARGGRGRSGRGGRGRGMMNRIGYRTYDNYEGDEYRSYDEHHRGYDEEERMLLMQMLGLDGNERYNDYGDEHFNKQEAKQTVDEMYHVKDGKKYIGEKYDMQKAHEVCSKFKDKLEDEVEVADVYVAINAQYHDYCELFEKWFGKGNFDDMIFESAISFWFDDVDFGEDKLWKYFNELK